MEIRSKVHSQMASITYDGTNFEEVLRALDAVKGGIKFSDHDDPGSPPNISLELADGSVLDINVGQTVEIPDATGG